MHVGGQEPGMHKALYLPGRGTGYVCDPAPGRHTAAPVARIDGGSGSFAPYPELKPEGCERYEYNGMGTIFMMKRKGCSIIFVNQNREILLQLRDDNPDIPYPNTWDVPGGHLEGSESPRQCIVREMKEEMGLAITGFRLFSLIEFEDRTEYTFWQELNLAIDRIHLKEGQCVRWFSEENARATELAYGFNRIVDSFFRQAPYSERSLNPAAGPRIKKSL